MAPETIRLKESTLVNLFAQ